ncbi:uncharacterized protein LOC124269286 [Haliotis rubra]|uniref:uncharacterized protein LOC124269286 n=1 Tax=Haliotis rubra TaxID=36100 RepID=UPI001EE501B0|nr:uncharacterized protein LOC124269286 [Haliotis rubra]
MAARLTKAGRCWVFQCVTMLVMLLVAMRYLFIARNESRQEAGKRPLETPRERSILHGKASPFIARNESRQEAGKRPLETPRERSILHGKASPVRVVDKKKQNVKPVSGHPNRKSKKLCVEGVIPLNKFVQYDPDVDTDLAVVSAYFNVGRFKKGLTKDLYFNVKTYTNWAGAFSNLYNPLVFYTDSDIFENIIRTLRIKLPRNLTRVIRVNQTSMWSFKLQDRISKIYHDPNYPKFYPNTVVPKYSCAMHAKYEVVEDAILKKYVTSDYVTWLDVGYFRYLKRNKLFKLVVPKSFSDNTVAFNKLHHPDPVLEPEVIFKNNSLYVGGGMFIGTQQTMSLFILDYRHASEVLLHMGLSNSDQQVLYAMYHSTFQSRVNPGVDLQLYKSNIVGDCWFYLGFQCYRELH